MGVASVLWFTYARVSREEQAKLGFSLSSQVEECRRRAAELGATQIVDFMDEGVPGDLLERPGLSKLRESIMTGGVTGLVVYDPDRLARNLSHQLLLTEALDRAGVRIEFVNFEWKDTAEGKLFYSIRGAIAEYEKEKIRERTVRGRRQKAKQGRLSGHPHTYGYQFDPVTDTLTPHPEQARVVKNLFQWQLDEQVGSRVLAERLNRMGVPAPRGERWWPGTVRRILLNRTYTGVLHVMRYDFTGVHKNRFKAPEERKRVRERPQEEWMAIGVPPIVDERIWLSVQEYMKNANRLWRARERTNHLLTGLTRCGLCGRPVSGTSSRGYTYYRCVGYLYQRYGSGPCGLRQRNAVELENQVWEEVKGWIHDPERLRQLIEGVPDGGGREINIQEELNQIERALANIGKERHKVVNLYQKELLSEEDVIARLRHVKGREGSLRERQAQLQALTVRADRQYWDEFSGAACELAGRLEGLTDAERRVILRWMVQEVVIYRDRVVALPKRPVTLRSTKNITEIHL